MRAVCDHLLAMGYSPDDLAIRTPYSAQAFHLAQPASNAAEHGDQQPLHGRKERLQNVESLLMGDATVSGVATVRRNSQLYAAEAIEGLFFRHSGALSNSASSDGAVMAVQSERSLVAKRAEANRKRLAELAQLLAGDPADTQRLALTEIKEILNQFGGEALEDSTRRSLLQLQALMADNRSESDAAKMRLVEALLASRKIEELFDDFHKDAVFPLHPETFWQLQNMAPIKNWRT